MENGGVASDLRSITYRIRKDVQWSDGTPLTAHDVVFSGEYCLHPDAGCNAASYFTDVTGFEALDDHTVKISFGVAKPFPYGPFVGSTSPIIQKAQFADCMGARAQECPEQNFGPIGTGPFKVDEFRANDVITFSANERYRGGGQARIRDRHLQGRRRRRFRRARGAGDRRVRLRLEPAGGAGGARADGRRRQGQASTAFGTWVERLIVNQTNDDPGLGPDKRSLHLDGANPHPFLSDPAVRRALSLAIDRQILVDAGYGAAGQPSCNILPRPRCTDRPPTKNA